MEQTGRFCSNCGTPINPGAGFCASCGQPITPASPAPEPASFQPPVPPAPQYVPPPPQPPPSYSSAPPPYMPPPTGGNTPSGKSILFWAVWAVLAILSGVMLADGFSFLRFAGLVLLLLFPLLTRKSLFRKMRTSLVSWVGVFVAFILVVSLFPAGPGKSASSGAIKTGK
ncbi:MAG: zinc ribbon domain-containing protein, partial [Dehalococcoidia bacterium]